jgi:putative endonuclease
MFYIVCRQTLECIFDLEYKLMTPKQKRGNRGEDIAAKYLMEKGYTVIERQHRKPWGELDIIAQAGDGTLIFVEVKAMGAGAGQFTPEGNMTPAKVMKTKRAALAYANANPKLSGRGWRIDVIAVDLAGDAATGIRHYENI